MKRLILAAALTLGLAGGALSYNAIAHEDQMAKHTVVWFEIPATDINRAVAFYNKVLGIELNVNGDMGVPMALFPHSEDAVSGALIQMDEVKPGADGPVIYLNGGHDLQPVLDRVPEAGGTILIPKTKISDEIGYFAIFKDTEGNRIGLFSAK